MNFLFKGYTATMDSVLVPILLVSIVLTLALAYGVIYWVQHRSQPHTGAPSADVWLEHVTGCGLIYPAVVVYIACGLQDLL